MTEEIVCIPWIDHDFDWIKGKAWWNKSTYWAYEDGTFSIDSCSDGDYDPVDHEDIPTWEEAQKEWDKYYLDCIKTGEDPLGEFYIQYHKKTVQRWQVYFSKSIAGVVVQRVRRNGVLFHRWELPKAVRDYLCMRDNGTSSNTEATLEDLETEGMKLYRWETFRLEQQEYRAESAVARDIRKAARKAYNMRAGRTSRSHLRALA